MSGHNGGPDDIPRLNIIRVHINDWRASMSGMSCEEEGFAWRLTLLQYDHMGQLIDDDAYNARAMSMDIRAFKRLKARLVEMKKIFVRAGQITHPRIEREIEMFVIEYKRRSEAAKEREDRRRTARTDDKIGATSAGLRPDFARTSAGSSPEVGRKSETLPPELIDDLSGNTNEINGSTATVVGTTVPEPSCARAFPKPKPKPKPIESEERGIVDLGLPALVAEATSPTPRDTGMDVDPLAAFEAWNDLALRCGLPQARTMTPARRKSIGARIREHGGQAAWHRALANIERSAFLRGTNDRGWFATLDFLCQPSSFAKVVDGIYGNGAGHAPKPDKPKHVNHGMDFVNAQLRGERPQAARDEPRNLVTIETDWSRQ